MTIYTQIPIKEDEEYVLLSEAHVFISQEGKSGSFFNQFQAQKFSQLMRRVDRSQQLNQSGQKRSNNNSITNNRAIGIIKYPIISLA